MKAVAGLRFDRLGSKDLRRGRGAAETEDRARDRRVGVAQRGVDPYRRAKAGKHWVFLRLHPYRGTGRRRTGLAMTNDE